jgi:3-oxoacyl-[acyl-carrier-protein] synthase II
MTLYVNGISSISPQESSNDEPLLIRPYDYRGTTLNLIEPDYDQWLDSPQLRRQSRISKVNMTAALMALNNAKLNNPDGILIATGLGCLNEEELFLKKMLEDNEVTESSPFFQTCTHSLGSDLAMLLQCTGFVQTYTHNAFSFENCLLDAIMHVAEEPAKKLLIGAVDVHSKTTAILQERLGLSRKKQASTLRLFSHIREGTVFGEGAAYFVVTGNQEKHSIASIHGVKTLYQPSPKMFEEAIEILIREHALFPAEIDLVLTGLSGSRFEDKMLNDVLKKTFPKNLIGSFKHLCGEYPVATSFALWLAARILQSRQVPEIVVHKNSNKPIKNVLILNSYFGTHFSITLLQSCPIRK